jgi:hypothetical protein
MTEMLNHFRKEVVILRNKYKDELAIDPVLPEIEALIVAFEKTVQSGASTARVGPVIAETIKKALSFEPLSELTGKDTEWLLIYKANDLVDNIYQNKRNRVVFKEGREGKPYFVDAFTWWDTTKNETWVGYIGLSDNHILSSNVYIRDLSKFSGKTFCIEVQVDEKNNDTYVIKNPELLREAEELYELIYRN